MIRTQIQLEKPMYETLRKKAFQERKSFAATVRDLLAVALALKQAGPKKPKYHFTFVGKYRGTARDVAERHDYYLNRGRRW